jgi:polyphosphate kinase
MFPVEDAYLKAKVLYALWAMFRDNVRSRWLGPDGVYRRRPPARGEPPFRIQQYLQAEASRASASESSLGPRSAADSGPDR